MNRLILTKGGLVSLVETLVSRQANSEEMIDFIYGRVPVLLDASLSNELGTKFGELIYFGQLPAEMRDALENSH